MFAGQIRSIKRACVGGRDALSAGPCYPRTGGSDHGRASDNMITRVSILEIFQLASALLTGGTSTDSRSRHRAAMSRAANLAPIT